MNKNERYALDIVVSCAGTSESVKKAWETRRKGGVGKRINAAAAKRGSSGVAKAQARKRAADTIRAWRSMPSASLTVRRQQRMSARRSGLERGLTSLKLVGKRKPNRFKALQRKKKAQPPSQDHGGRMPARITISLD